LLPPATPGPIFAISMIESQRRAPSIFRFAPGAAILGRLSAASSARRAACRSAWTSIWPFSMIRGGDMAMMSPVVRIRMPAS
jgi:hypothetical protein